MKSTIRRLHLILLTLMAGLSLTAATEPRKIVLVAGPKSHGPEGNRIHDYPWSVKLLKVMLDNCDVAGQLRVEYHLDGWPKDERVFDEAATVVVISDGRDGDLFREAPHLESPERVAFMERLMKRGCGLVTFHFSTFGPDKYAEQMLRWNGGYFGWETEGKRKWYSAITTLEGEVFPATPGHAVLRGVGSFHLREEFYYNLRFNPQDTATKPILEVPGLAGREPDGRVVAWAREREDGGRGFGTTCGHFYDNWRQDTFRRLMLNAIVWTAGIPVPDGGVHSRFYTHEQITAALAGGSGTTRAVASAEKPIRALILTGHDASFHPWRLTHLALKEAVERDPRFAVSVTTNIEDLATLDLKRFDVLVQNYSNWQRPGQLSDGAKAAFTQYLNQGGGLVIVHFANGAWNFSLPDAGASDWPEYRRICRRVWNHFGKGEAQSSHDPYGPFTVRVTSAAHPLTAGLKDFETTDELYFRQDGTEPIEPLVVAHSKVTGRDEPLAWTYLYGLGRVFQTVLGHDEKSVRAAGELIGRGAAWAAGRATGKIFPGEENLNQTVAPPKTAEIKSAQGLASLSPAFGRALSGGLKVEGKADYRARPVTIECRAKLNSKGGFNILVASDPKSSAEHWELYSYAGDGAFSVYQPGCGGEFRSEVNICDGQWHYLAAILEPDRVRLYADGRLVKDAPAKPMSGNPVPGGLAFGTLVEGGAGCDGLVDDVRISRGIRNLSGVPPGPLPRDDQTLGLWNFDDLKATDGK